MGKKNLIETPCPFDERRTHRRPADAPAGDHVWPGCPGPKRLTEGGPAQVASDQYRDRYDDTFN
jgi:hypothetical protein